MLETFYYCLQSKLWLVDNSFRIYLLTVYMFTRSGSDSGMSLVRHGLSKIEIKIHAVCSAIVSLGSMFTSYLFIIKLCLFDEEQVAKVRDLT